MDTQRTASQHYCFALGARLAVKDSGIDQTLDDRLIARTPMKELHDWRKPITATLAAEAAIGTFFALFTYV